MTNDKLNDANYLAGQIEKAEKKLAELHHGDLNVVIIPHKQTMPIMTIGTSGNCEHDASPLAVDFLLAIRAHYEAELEKLKAQFNAL